MHNTLNVVNHRSDYSIIICAAEEDEFAIGWSEENVIVVELRGGNVAFLDSASVQASMRSLWTGWHKHCFTWRSNGYFEVTTYQIVAEMTSR